MVAQGVTRWAETRYPRAIGWALAHPVQTLGSAVALFVLTLVFVLPRLGTELIPQMSQGEFNVDLRLPPGAPLEQTDRAVRATQQASCRARQRGPGLLRGRHRQPARCQSGGRRREHRTPQHHPGGRRGTRRGGRRHAGPARQPREPAGRPVPLQPALAVRSLDAARGRRLGLRPRPASRRGRAGSRAHGRRRALRGRQDDRRGRQPRDPDRVRPGARGAARASSCATSRTASSTAFAARSRPATSSATSGSTCWCAAWTTAPPPSRRSAT